MWRFGKESNRLWHQVIAAKYGEARGGWCTRGVRVSHGCGMWRSIKEGIDKFFSQILYNVGEGCRVSFWHDPWSGPIPSKELFYAMIACSLSKEAWVFDLVVSISKGGRSWNLLFGHGPQDWEATTVYSFFELIYSFMPRGEGDDHLVWRLTTSGVFDVRSFYKLLSSPDIEV